MPGALEDVPAYVEAVVPIVERMHRDLSALEQPADDKQIDVYLQKLAASSRTARQAGAAATEGDAAEARRLGRRTQRLTDEARQLAGKLGAGACAGEAS